MKSAADAFPPDKKPAQALPVVGLKDGPHTRESGEGAEARPEIFRDPLLYTNLHMPRPRAPLSPRRAARTELVTMQVCWLRIRLPEQEPSIRVPIAQNIEEQ